MKKEFKHLVIIISLAAFLSATSGFGMVLHLQSCENHEEHQEHDHEHCPICKQISLISKQYICEVYDIVIQYNEIQTKKHIYKQIFVKRSAIEIFIPRGPPAKL